VNRRAFVRGIAQGTVAAAAVASPSYLFAGAGTASRNDYRSIPEATFKTSVMLWTVSPDLPIEARLEKVAAAGYKNVELIGEFKRWSPDDYLRVNSTCRELGLQFDATAGVGHGLRNPESRAALLAEVRAMLPLMERLNCPALILFSGSCPAGVARGTLRQSCIDGLQGVAELVAGKNINGQPIRVLVENLDEAQWPGYYLTSAAEGFEIVKSINHPQVQLLYDLFHGQLAEGNLIQKLEKNLGYVGTIHVADVPGRHEPGTGEINYDMVFRKLGELRYNGIVAMEFIPTGDPVARLRGARELAMVAAAQGAGTQS